MICALRISQAGLESHAKVGSALRPPMAFTSLLLRCVCHAAAPAYVCRVISVTSLAKQKLSPYKYGNLMVELSCLSGQVESVMLKRKGLLNSEFGGFVFSTSAEKLANFYCWDPPLQYGEVNSSQAFLLGKFCAQQQPELCQSLCSVQAKLVSTTEIPTCLQCGRCAWCMSPGQLHIFGVVLEEHVIFIFVTALNASGHPLWFLINLSSHRTF